MHALFRFEYLKYSPSICSSIINFHLLNVQCNVALCQREAALRMFISRSCSFKTCNVQHFHPRSNNVDFILRTKLFTNICFFSFSNTDNESKYINFFHFRNNWSFVVFILLSNTCVIKLRNHILSVTMIDHRWRHLDKVRCWHFSTARFNIVRLDSIAWMLTFQEVNDLYNSRWKTRESAFCFVTYEIKKSIFYNKRERVCGKRIQIQLLR